MAESGSALCKSCGNGYISRLACAQCNKLIPSGHSYCSGCSRGGIDPVRHDANREYFPGSGEMVVPPRHEQAPMNGLVLPPLPPGISMERTHVSESRSGGRLGAIADIQMSGRDADILTKMNQVVVLLHALAGEMNNFVALSPDTRRIIKGCRNLAADLQEEVETRIGPAR
jgi:hypothetical protein